MTSKPFRILLIHVNDTCINVSPDWQNRIDYIPSKNICSNACLSVKYLTMWWISGAPEYEPICPAYSGATERDNWGRKNTDKGTREVQEQMDDGEEVLDSENTPTVLIYVLNIINDEFEDICLDEAVRVLNARPICQSITDLVPGNMYAIPSLPGTKLLAHQVWAIWFILRS